MLWVHGGPGLVRGKARVSTLGRALPSSPRLCHPSPRTSVCIFPPTCQTGRGTSGWVAGWCFPWGGGIEEAPWCLPLTTLALELELKDEDPYFLCSDWASASEASSEGWSHWAQTSREPGRLASKDHGPQGLNGVLECFRFLKVPKTSYLLFKIIVINFKGLGLFFKMLPMLEEIWTKELWDLGGK